MENETHLFFFKKKKNSFQNFMSQISGKTFHKMPYIIYKVIMHFFSQILTKTLKLHLSVTIGQQNNAFEQFEVMKS